MSGWDLFAAAFVVALAVLAAWYLWILLLEPAARFLIEQARAGLVRRSTFTALDPSLAVARYLAAGGTPEHGMPTLAELQWIYSLAAVDRFGWASNVVDAFERQLPAGKKEDYTVTLDDLGLAPQTPMRAAVALYLETVAQGFPIVGVWRWNRS